VAADGPRQRQQDKPADSDRSRTGNGGDEDPAAIDPIIGGLLKRLPKPAMDRLR
jgi:hypothetical protein